MNKYCSKCNHLAKKAAVIFLIIFSKDVFGYEKNGLFLKNRILLHRLLFF